MQRNTKILLAAVCAIAAVGLAVFLRKEPDPVRPFQELKGENIASASVELTPPGETVEVKDGFVLIDGQPLAAWIEIRYNGPIRKGKG